MWDHGFGRYLYIIVMGLSAAGFLWVASRSHGVLGSVGLGGFVVCVLGVFWQISIYVGRPRSDDGATG